MPQPTLDTDPVTAPDTVAVTISAKPSGVSGAASLSGPRCACVRTRISPAVTPDFVVSDTQRSSIKGWSRISLNGSDILPSSELTMTPFLDQTDIVSDMSAISSSTSNINSSAPRSGCKSFQTPAPEAPPATLPFTHSCAPSVWPVALANLACITVTLMAKVAVLESKVRPAVPCRVRRRSLNSTSDNRSDSPPTGAGASGWQSSMKTQRSPMRVIEQTATASLVGSSWTVTATGNSATATPW
mmetsp:Transcript_26069/g.60128  ORF Transcript_26069/g.60128 Transcript_26069/m.60128 type:complete len:243 (+) Transcript_26069:446-1174(+)